MARQSAAVYRRRRLVVVVALLVVIAALAAGIWLVMSQPWNRTATPAADRSPAASTAPATDAATPPAVDPASPPASDEPAVDAPSPDPSDGPEIVACEAPDVEVKAVTDAETYAAGVMPKLSISLTNKTDRDCTLNVGSSMQKFTVTSGKDVWWRSTDCQTDPSDQIATLAAGATVSTRTPVVWDRTRSSVDSCDNENRPRAPGGGASYHVSVSIGGFDSARSQQIFLR